MMRWADKLSLKHQTVRKSNRATLLGRTPPSMKTSTLGEKHATEHEKTELERQHEADQWLYDHARQEMAKVEEEREARHYRN